MKGGDCSEKVRNVFIYMFKSITEDGGENGKRWRKEPWELSHSLKMICMFRCLPLQDIIQLKNRHPWEDSLNVRFNRSLDGQTDRETSTVGNHIKYFVPEY